jgi:enoyl-[acyl-carrier protein] reductase I
MQSRGEQGVVMTQLMQGKRGLIMGVANDHSIAWGIAKTLSKHGATLAFTYQGEAIGKRVRPLASSIGADLTFACDVEDLASMDRLFAALADTWGSIDFLVHAIAFSDRGELKGRYADTSRANFVRTMVISCFSFTEVAKRSAALMSSGGSLLTLTYGGSTRVMPNYNVMGVAKAALECAVRYIAAELGPKGIRVHAISPGPLATRAASGIPEFDALLDKARAKAPARSLVSIDDVGLATAFLAHDAARLITGETLYIDGGYHIID